MSIREDWPLVTFTLLFPTSVATYLLALLAPASFGALQSAGMAIAWALATVALLLTPLHLGRPLRAFRTIANLSRSWLSRETTLAALYVGLLFLHTFEPVMQLGFPGTTTLMALTLGIGLAAVAASARSYCMPARPGWHFGRTLTQFGGAGISTALLLALVLFSEVAAREEWLPFQATAWLKWMAGLSVLWIVLQWLINRHETRAFMAHGERLPAHAAPEDVWRVYRTATMLAAVAVALLLSAIILRPDTLLFLLALIAEMVAGWFYRLAFFARGRPLSVESLIERERLARLDALTKDA
jgi:DMSO reductase anchor subunit